MKVNVLIVGVGGQGVLTTSGLLARAGMYEGLNVVSAETHGMAQRGGSVEVHLRFGDVRAPLIPYGHADFIASLEPVEVLRYGQYMNENTVVLMNTRPISPPSVSTGDARYPSMDEILERVEGVTENIHLINASEIAERLGNIQAANVVMAGALIGLGLPLSIESVEMAIADVMPEKIRDLNVKALREGFAAGQRLRK
ncbi:indolepyruvate ferredoxin oxidoreductase, beta subunit [Geoglobus ahangari]|uniref:Indolepyruvate ferredoxin oxidoreductase subunit beta n=1 Tax=Geoglobus ahangari TaxID=113653 RepID=A0A0F7IDU2_9EURY|nr:indolepyruvate ferredoxin oxidoreductase subunit beta [Geoglobus ahangari]AKG91664.1 indolepyruvate ferredoxin oxidoreductase, beta subunit [Geoglobus ahangari]